MIQKLDDDSLGQSRNNVDRPFNLGAGISVISEESVIQILQRGMVGNSSPFQRGAADSDSSLIKIEGVDDPKSATSVYLLFSTPALWTETHSFTDSILARRLLSSIGCSERFEGQRFESFGEKSPAHTVCRWYFLLVDMTQNTHMIAQAIQA